MLSVLFTPGCHFCSCQQNDDVQSFLIDINTINEYSQYNNNLIIKMKKGS